MKLIYTQEVLYSPDGVACKVLDTSCIDFNDAAEGRKSLETLVRRAKGGEEIKTKNSEGQVESSYVAAVDDAIFINLHNFDDMYVPADADGKRWKFNDIENKGYEITGNDFENDGVRVKSLNTFRLLTRAVHEPTCIKDAWGAGQHQFLFSGATLKQVSAGKVTGIDGEAFDATWEIT